MDAEKRDVPRRFGREGVLGEYEKEIESTPFTSRDNAEERV
jgi:hypothetical protein